MEYLSTEVAISITRRLKIVTEYVPGCGARCPLCGDWSPAKSGCKKQKNGQNRRYHICCNCSYRFVSEELS